MAERALGEGRSTGHADVNLLGMLLAHGTHPAKLAARYKVKGRWKDASWGELTERVRRLSAGLGSLGVKPGDRVCIFSPSRFEWALANLACYGVGAVAVPIYASNTSAETEYIVRDSGARVLFVDGDQPEGRMPGRWSRVKQARANLPELTHVISFDLSSKREEGLLGLMDVESQGAVEMRTRPDLLEEYAARLKPEDLAYVIYTSGTTGTPKGVMLTHANWVSQGRSANEIGLITERDTILLFLPLAHCFALVAFAAWIRSGCVMAFAESIERAVDNCAEVKATIMPAVPRVFEKAFNRVIADGNGQPGVKGKLFAWAMAQFEEYAEARAAGREYASVQWTLARRLVFGAIEEKLKKRFGGNVREFVSGGAPLSRKIAYFFDICGLLVLEGYGLTETSAPTHCNRPQPGGNLPGTVGQPFPGVQVRIADDGEILLKGPQVMKGYYNLPDDTAAIFDADGWLHTGDIGEQDARGFLRITDRKKDLIKTSGGKYVAPQELENALKTDPLVSQVMVHGDRRKFVSALITVNEEGARKWAREKGVSFTDLADLSRRPELFAAIKVAVDAVNANRASYAAIRKFVVLDHDWSQETGELTPTLKVKRKEVTAKYQAMLDKLYDGDRF